MIRSAIFTLAMLFVQSVAGAASLPKDVQAFISNAETCEHMAGEWDSELPKARRREITTAIKKYCAPAKRQLSVLTKKYRDNPSVSRAISEHAFDSVKSYTDVDRR